MKLWKKKQFFGQDIVKHREKKAIGKFRNQIMI